MTKDVRGVSIIQCLVECDIDSKVSVFSETIAAIAAIAVSNRGMSWSSVSTEIRTTSLQRTLVLANIILGEAHTEWYIWNGTKVSFIERCYLVYRSFL